MILRHVIFRSLLWRGPDQFMMENRSEKFHEVPGFNVDEKRFQEVGRFQKLKMRKE